MSIKQTFCNGKNGNENFFINFFYLFLGGFLRRDGALDFLELNKFSLSTSPKLNESHHQTLFHKLISDINQNMKTFRSPKTKLAKKKEKMKTLLEPKNQIKIPFSIIPFCPEKCN
jgi:hypothetical protein